MLGQIVWVEGLETVNGEYVANVYPSYEQVLKVFSKQRMAGLYTISPLIKQQIGTIYNRMLSDLKNSSPARDYVATPPKNDPKSKNGSAQPARITSYNVCYTKLLRAVRRSSTKPAGRSSVSRTSVRPSLPPTR